MPDALDKLADDVRNATIKACAKVADILRVRAPENEYQKGYNKALADYADGIRRIA